MKLKFDSSLEYQQDAINAVVDIFEGQPLAQSCFELSHTSGALGFKETLAVGNALMLSDDQLLANMHSIQERNSIEKSETFDRHNFSIEMETGTGKTYVYLRTLFELNQRYGFKKFIIIVPSIAVREGVLKSIDMTKEHFSTLYGNVSFHHFVYDSTQLSKVTAFSKNNNLEVMIINIQSFQRQANIFNQDHEQCYGYCPKELIVATKPIVIIDEPQSVDSGKRSQEAVLSLEAAVILRYSATHKNPINLLYKLDPIKAYDKRLVKRIEVASVQAENNFNEGYVNLLKTDNRRGIRAFLQIHKQRKGGGQVTLENIWVKKGDDLFAKSGEREVYKQGYSIQNIDCTPGAEYIEFNRGLFLRLGEEKGGLKEDVMKAQIRETVKQHLEKERVLSGKGIKVLSLFFIDKVSNYRTYHENGTTQLGKLGQWFEEAYETLSKKPPYKELILSPVDQVHNGYFSRDRQGKGIPKDTMGSAKDDENTYNLIMKDKERLLSFEEPLRFIFTHSALREGWDNPNVFQICTLNETRSVDKKRQEIGRGLRLPVNAKGERVRDESINRLTIIANEPYEQFAKTLQVEFEEEGYQFNSRKHIGNAHERRAVQLNKHVYLSPEFQDLWDKIKQKTRYRVEFDTSKLIEKAAQTIEEKLSKIILPQIHITRAEVDITETGVSADRVLENLRYNAETVKSLPDILAFLQKETELTRHTLVEILKKCARLPEFVINPSAFMITVCSEIARTLQEEIIGGIRYEKIDNHYWEMKRFDDSEEGELTSYLNRLYEVKNTGKSVYKCIEFDSDIEERFAKDLDNNESVKLFVKLPRWFQIDTPVGRYNPDWALVMNQDEQLYFVCETKGSLDDQEWRSKEKQKIDCGGKHFKAIDVRYKVATQFSELLKSL